jgi:hypothetical protein
MRDAHIIVVTITIHRRDGAGNGGTIRAQRPRVPPAPHIARREHSERQQSFCTAANGSAATIFDGAGR